MTTKKQGKQIRDEIMQFIIAYIEQHGYAPSFREIGIGVGRSSMSSIHHHIQILIDEGRLETDAIQGSPRALRVPGYKFVKEE